MAFVKIRLNIHVGCPWLCAAVVLLGEGSDDLLSGKADARISMTSNTLSYNEVGDSLIPCTDTYSQSRSISLSELQPVDLLQHIRNCGVHPKESMAQSESSEGQTGIVGWDKMG